MSDELEDLLILDGDNSILFHNISNADGKVWQIPDKHLKTGLQLYQPSSLKGMLFKRFYPYFKKVSFITRKLGVSTIHYGLSSKFQTFLKQLYKADIIDVSIFRGTPSTHQKVTIQVSSGNYILGYVKISAKSDIVALFHHEAAILNELKNQSVVIIPECLFCECWNKGYTLFAQTTVKTLSSKVLHQLTNLHWHFLEKLYRQTKRKFLFEETDFFNTLQTLKNYLSSFFPQDKLLLSNVIVKVELVFRNQVVEYSAYHSDFTPWNTFLEKGNLFVFDWEYSRRTYPPYLDAYHFFTQTCIFEKKLNAAAIYKMYLSKRETFSNYIENPDLMYECYLLEIISFYSKRENGVFENDVERNMSIWLKLLSYFQK